MRAAAIFGLGSSTRDLKPFQHDPAIEWNIGLPNPDAGADAILIFGGDGTIHRHLSQLVKIQVPVLVVPRGSGNDFARALDLRNVRDSETAWQNFCAGNGHVRSIDLGIIRPLRPAAEPASSTGSSDFWFPDTGHFFCCVGGCGLDAETGRRANAMPAWLRGHGGYVLGLLATLPRFKPVNMNVQVADGDSAGQFVTRSSGPAMLLAFANTPVYGGGMRIAPRAELDDGKLDFCLIRQVGKLRLTYLFPTVYFGKHLKIREIDYFQGERLRIEADRPVDVYADGEYVCRTPAEVGIAPNALKVIVL